MRKQGPLTRLQILMNAPAATLAPYAIVCGCGHTLRGERQMRYQVAACPRCGRPVFILSRSPFHAGGPGSSGGRLAGWAWWRSRLAWLMPALAAVATLALLAALFLVLRPYLLRQGQPAEEANPRRLIESGKQALSRGAFQRADDDLRGALQLAQEKPAALSPLELREVRQLQQEANLLAGLLSQSLQEVLDQAMMIEVDDEWQSRFRKDFLDKTILFDTVALLDDRRRPEVKFKTIQSGEVEARLGLDQLDMLSHLSLGNQPRRVVFGARLAGFSREQGGRWVITFKPDSGILLTDPSALRACTPLLVDRDDDILTVLRRQKEWVEQNP
jgi:hypothetical protein